MTVYTKFLTPPQQAALADGGGDARGSARTAGGGRCGDVGSALPSNTALHNSIPEYFKLLRFGVDSLYLSYQGNLLPEVQEHLVKLKQLAQNPEEDQQALAQLTTSGHVFKVMDRGSSMFPFILEDGAFRIQLSRASKRLPMAYVKLSSRYLTSVMPREAEAHLRGILSKLGDLEGSAHVSRIDLCADFSSNVAMDSWRREAWVTRAKNIAAYAVSDEFTGWTVGLGGNIAFRLYNKTIEVKHSGRDDLAPLWEAAGWKEGETIWRGEVQLEREVLAQHGQVTLENVLNNLNGWWSYALTEWLRLTIPNPSDSTRTRWPVHPLWGYLSSVDWETNGGPLARSFKATRVPENKRIFSLGVSAIASFMAKNGITDYGSGIDAFLDGLFGYLQSSGEFVGVSAEDRLIEKVRLRAREFNTITNRVDAEWQRIEEDKKRAEIEAGAKAYLKASKGG